MRGLSLSPSCTIRMMRPQYTHDRRVCHVTWRTYANNAVFPVGVGFSLPSLARANARRPPLVVMFVSHHRENRVMYDCQTMHKGHPAETSPHRDGAFRSAVFRLRASPRARHPPAAWRRSAGPRSLSLTTIDRWLPTMSRCTKDTRDHSGRRVVGLERQNDFCTSRGRRSPPSGNHGSSRSVCPDAAAAPPRTNRLPVAASAHWRALLAIPARY